MRRLPTAAIPVGAVVLAETRLGQRKPATIERIHNNDPVPGSIRWETRNWDGHVLVGGAELVEIVSLP